MATPAARIGGRAAAADIIADGLFKYLREASKAYPKFDEEAKKVAAEVARVLIERAKKNANAIPPHGKARAGSWDGISTRSQAQVVAQALTVRRDRLISIRLRDGQVFKSQSYPNRKRQASGKVTMGKVFFGAEFGGRRKKTTQQFLPHRGRQGYFFWQAVRDNKSFIAKMYFDMLEQTLERLAADAK